MLHLVPENLFYSIFEPHPNFFALIHKCFISLWIDDVGLTTVNCNCLFAIIPFLDIVGKF